MKIENHQLLEDHLHLRLGKQKLLERKQVQLQEIKMIKIIGAVKNQSFQRNQQCLKLIWISYLFRIQVLLKKKGKIQMILMLHKLRVNKLVKLVKLIKQVKLMLLRVVVRVKQVLG